MVPQMLPPVLSYTPCLLVHLYIHASIALSGASQIIFYLYSVTYGSWIIFILTSCCIPFRHMYSVFAIDTFVPIFSQGARHCSSSNSSAQYFSIGYSTTSSTNVICQDASLLVFFISESINMANRKWLKADPCGDQLPLQRVRLFL